MGKVIDITSRLTNDRPKLKIRDKEFEIDHSKNTVLVMNQKIDEARSIEDREVMDSIFELMLGKSALDEINEMGLSYSDHRFIFLAILAGATNEEFEKVEARFLNETT